MYNQGRGGGRGGGFGGGKRPMTALPLRPVSASGSTRSSIGGGGPRRPGTSHGGSSGGGTPAGKEESFTLSTANKFEFGSIVRLTPDLVEEILRVESQGGVAKIKFAPKEGIATGNVIDVGGKEFGFKWFNDQKCDIYEEHRSGENGDGLLVECGPSWRQLNVDRILDESMKRLVKKRSEEAEIKSRVTIVLDPSNPGVVQKMAAAGVEGNNRRMGWNKRESYPKRQKADSIQGSHKPLFKSVTSNKTAKAVSASPISSPFTTGTSSKYARGVTPPIDINTEHIDIGNSEKEGPTKNVHGSKNKFGGQRMHTNDPFMNVQNSREGKSSENANDISSKIEAAKRYLKPAVEADNSTRRGYESPSPPRNSLDIALATESIFGEKNIDENHAVPSPKLAVEDEEDPFEKIDIMQDTPDPFNNNDKKVTNDSDGKTNSSESGTDSDSESDSSGSDSGSQSRSRSKSKSKSPAGSASSSDSESDVSSSSKEVSDIDVNIMTSGDEKEEDVPNLSAMNDNEQIDIMEDQQIDILGDDEDNVANDFGRNDNMTYPSEDAINLYTDSSMKNAEVPGNILDSRIVSDSHRENSRYSVDSPHTQHTKTLNDTDEKPQNENDDENLPIFNDWSANEKAERRKNKKSRRGTGSEASKENSEYTKRYKEAKEAKNISPGKNKQNEHQLYNNQLDAKDDFPHNTKMQRTPEFFSSSNVDAEYGHIGARRKSTGGNSRKKMEWNPTHTDIRDMQTDFNANEKLSSIHENNGLHNRDFNHKNKSPVPSVDARVLRREVSELELGELREPVADPKASLKNTDNKSTSNDSSNPQRTYFQGQKHSTIDCTDPERSIPSLPSQLYMNNDSQRGHKSVKESKQKKEKTLVDSTKVVNNGNLLENGSNKKTGDCSMEDSSSFYSKYDKEVPELRDSIKGYTQYTDYVQEFQEKYDCYVSLRENLEKIKNEFLKTGEELELAKGGSAEEYYKVVRRLREMYEQDVERNNQMKRVFTVLHEELKTLKQRIQDFVDTYSRE